MQHGRCDDTIVDPVEITPHVQGLTQPLHGRLAVPGSSAAAEVKVLMDFGSSTTAMSDELIPAPMRPPGMTLTALTQAFVGHARVMTSLGRQCDVDTPSCPLGLTTVSPWGPVQFTLPFIVLPRRGDVVIAEWKTLGDELGVDVMAQLKASVLKVQGRQGGHWIEHTAIHVGEPDAGALLRAAMAVTAFVRDGDGSGDVDGEVALTLPSQRPMIL